MGIWGKNLKSWRFVKRFAVIIVVALVFWYGYSAYVSPQARDDREARKFLEDLKQQYENDTYGGETPEETLALFIDALEKGDIDLASKYFVIDKQEEWRENLESIQSKNLIHQMISDLKRPKDKYPLIEGENNVFIFEIFNDNNELSIQMSFVRNSNNIWKIEDL